jgi:glycosyltransferase involved in cell wall biosynthesis
VYDSHELFTEVPELIERPRIRNIWLSIEKMILPKLKYMTTVNHSIALVFKEKYGILPTVVRNVPYAYTFQKCTRKELGLPEDKFIIIIQGSGLNIGRGVEEVILALRKLENLVLLIVGSGDVIQKAKDLTRENKLEKQVIFIPRIPYQEMMKYTEVSDLGLSLDKPLGMNYMYSLPNKIFDYLQANIPILCTDLKEVSRIVKTYECGTVLEQLNEETLVSELKNLSGNYPLIKKYKENAQSGAKIENWENEKSKLIEILQRAFN